jgi:hypothetical protein
MTDDDDFWAIDEGRSVTDQAVLAVAIIVVVLIVAITGFAAWKVLT